MNLILPVAGESSRYPNERPKWLLIHPSCTFMFIEAIKGLNLKAFRSIYIGCLREHIEKYNCLDGIINELKKIYKGTIKVIQLDKTKNQPETVNEVIKYTGMKGEFVVKDCDNYLEVNCINNNFVSYCDIAKTNSDKLGNKSYVQIDDNGYINNIVEKKVISDKFCSGCYGFKSAEDFTEYYNRLKNEKDLYISHIIYAMILDGIKFSIIESLNFDDWGTLDDWKKYV